MGTHRDHVGTHGDHMGTHEDPMDRSALPLERMTTFRPKPLTLPGVFEGTMTFVCIFTTIRRCELSRRQPAANQVEHHLDLFEAH
jgi:hypothetical protein